MNLSERIIKVELTNGYVANKKLGEICFNVKVDAVIVFHGSEIYGENLLTTIIHPWMLKALEPSMLGPNAEYVVIDKRFSDWLEDNYAIQQRIIETISSISTVEMREIMFQLYVELNKIEHEERRKI